MRIRTTLSALIFTAVLFGGIQAQATPLSTVLRPTIDASLAGVLPSVASIEVSLPGYSAFMAANGGAGLGLFNLMEDPSIGSEGLSDASATQVGLFGFGPGLLAFTGIVDRTGEGTQLGFIVENAFYTYDSSVTPHSDTLVYTFATGALNDPTLSPFGVTVIDQLNGVDDLGQQITTDLEALGLANGWNIILKDAGGNAVGGPTSISFFDLGGSTNMLLSAAVPVPAAVWLFGSALLGLVGIRRRRA